MHKTIYTSLPRSRRSLISLKKPTDMPLKRNTATIGILTNTTAELSQVRTKLSAKIPWAMTSSSMKSRNSSIRGVPTVTKMVCCPTLTITSTVAAWDVSTVSTAGMIPTSTDIVVGIRPIGMADIMVGTTHGTRVGTTHGTRATMITVSTDGEDPIVLIGDGVDGTAMTTHIMVIFTETAGQERPITDGPPTEETIQQRPPALSETQEVPLSATGIKAIQAEVPAASTPVHRPQEDSSEVRVPMIIPQEATNATPNPNVRPRPSTAVRSAEAGHRAAVLAAVGQEEAPVAVGRVADSEADDNGCGLHKASLYS